MKKTSHLGHAVEMPVYSQKSVSSIVEQAQATTCIGLYGCMGIFSCTNI